MSLGDFLCRRIETKLGRAMMEWDRDGNVVERRETSARVELDVS